LRTFAVVVLLLAVCTFSAHAQTGPKIQLLVDGELGFPTTPESFTDGWSAVGFGGGVGIGIELLPIVVVTANFNFTRVGLDEEGSLPLGISPDTVSVDGGAINVLYVWAGGKLYLMEEGSARPYVVGGLGYYRLSASDLDITSSGVTQTFEFESESVLGANAGIGVDVAVGDAMNVFFEGQYQIGFTEEESTGHVPVRVGLVFMFGQ